MTASTSTPFAPIAFLLSALCVSAVAFALAFFVVIPAGNLRLPTSGAAA